MTGAIAAKANPSINPYGGLNYSSQEEKAASV
jgi:hypothetical protein